MSKVKFKTPTQIIVERVEENEVLSSIANEILNTIDNEFKPSSIRVFCVVETKKKIDWQEMNLIVDAFKRFGWQISFNISSSQEGTCVYRVAISELNKINI